MSLPNWVVILICVEFSSKKGSWTCVVVSPIASSLESVYGDESSCQKLFDKSCGDLVSGTARSKRKRRSLVTVDWQTNPILFVDCTVGEPQTLSIITYNHRASNIYNTEESRKPFDIPHHVILFRTAFGINLCLNHHKISHFNPLNLFPYFWSLKVLTFLFSF